MSGNQTDLTFFTNDKHQTLLDRFKSTLADTQLFDVLVGYFRSSGSYQLHDSMEPIAKTWILVGLGLDDESYRAVNAYQNQGVLDFESHSNTKKQFQENLIQEVEDSTDTDQNLETGLKKIFLQNLPVAKPTGLLGYQLETLVDWVQYSKQANAKLQSKYFEQLIDGLIYELYFPDEIKAAGKEILKYLGNLKPITDAMSKEEILAVIQSEFDRLYDPKHPMRNHLETLDSVEEVRIIREALKK